MVTAARRLSVIAEGGYRQLGPRTGHFSERISRPGETHQQEQEDDSQECNAP